jgi:transcriptional regulator with XRE-family HTH domain
MDSSVPIGERIAIYRRRRGLSQAKLANLVGRSENWLSQIERGERPIQRLARLAELARVLEVPMTELIGVEPKPARDPEGQHVAVEQLRLALSGFDFLCLLVEPGQAETTAAPELPGLEADVTRAWELVHASRYTELAPVLCSMLAVGEARCPGIHGLPSREGVPPRRADVPGGRCDDGQARGDGSRLGGCRPCGDGRAERAGMPLLAIAGVYRLAQAFVSGWRLDQAERTASSGALSLAARLQDGDPTVISLFGALNLVRAIVASRRGDAIGAWRAVSDAEAAARQLGSDRNDFGTEFGPTNVQVHAVTVAVELGDAAEALRRAALIDTEVLSPERQARFLIDVARARVQRRDFAGAVEALRRAAALTTEQVRCHPLVRDLVRDLLADATDRPTPSWRRWR